MNTIYKMTTTYSTNQLNSATGSYYVKMARTTNTRTYILPMNILIDEFFRVIKLNIIDDFGFQSVDQFELVLAGQQIPGFEHAEDHPPIDIPNLTGKLYDNFKSFEAFYIRPIQVQSQVHKSYELILKN